MKQVGRATGAVIVLAIIVFASVFPVAELFMEIAVLRTFDDGGAPHETRLTVLDRDGITWVRGRPARSWFQRVTENPNVLLLRNGRWEPVQAEISSDPDDAIAFQQAAIDLYGFAYRYCDLIANMYPHEVPVRLVARSSMSPPPNKLLESDAAASRR